MRTQEGISVIFDCLMEVKQGCPLSATLFELFVDGLEQHLMDTLDMMHLMDTLDMMHLPSQEH